jgi:hypothetical protein
LQVKIATNSGEIDGLANNVSLGGMLVETSEHLPYGAVVKLRFRLPTMDSDTEVDATVRWNKERSFGMQFGSLRAKDVWGLNRLFEKSV